MGLKAFYKDVKKLCRKLHSEGFERTPTQIAQWSRQACVKHGYLVCGGNKHAFVRKALRSRQYFGWLKRCCEHENA